MKTGSSPLTSFVAGIIGLASLAVFAYVAYVVVNGNTIAPAPVTGTPISIPTGMQSVVDVKATVDHEFSLTEQAALTLYPSPAPGTLAAYPTMKPEATGFLPLPNSTPLGDGATFSGVMAPYSLGERRYFISSQWYLDLDDGRRRIYVGVGSLVDEGQAQPTDNGVVVVNFMEWVNQVGLTYPDIVPGGGEYRTPIDAGSLQIQGAQGARLTLLSTNGTTFYFDVPSQRYVSSLTEVVPTITPPPTYTRMPTPTATVLRTPYPAPNPSAYPAPVESAVAP